MENLVLAFQIYGLAILVSMAVAVLIKGIVVVLSRLKAKEQAKQKAAEPATPDIDRAGIPVEHIAAISAAAYSMLGRHRVVHIEDGGRGLSWTAEGRAAHHGSHSVPHHPKQ